MRREGFDIARFKVERLMRDFGLQDVIRGKPVRTTIGDKSAPANRSRPNPDSDAEAGWSGELRRKLTFDTRAGYGWIVSNPAIAYRVFTIPVRLFPQTHP